MESTKDVVIITDIGAVDPDDALAICMLPKLSNISIKGIITTHIYPTLKAKIARLLTKELGYDIPIYVGNGIEYADNFNEKDREIFLSENKLFPALFGFPKSVYNSSIEKQWFPNFMKGYDECFAEDIKSLNIEKTSGHVFLEELLKKYSENERLIVIVLSPMHDIAKISTDLYKNMDLYVMGGGFEQIDSKQLDQTISVNKLGYNWGVCPDIANKVLKKLSDTNTSMTLISSSIVRRKDISIGIDLFDEWVRKNNNKTNPPKKITNAIMTDWSYSLNSNKLSRDKLLCDPLTMYLSLNNSKQSFEYMQYDAIIHENILMTNYLQQSNDLMILTPNKQGNVKLIIDFPLDTKDKILKILNEVLFS